MRRLRLFLLGVALLPVAAGAAVVLACGSNSPCVWTAAIAACIALGAAAAWGVRRAVMDPARRNLAALKQQLEQSRAGDQEQLARTRQVTQTAIDSLPHAIAMLNADGRVDLANALAVKLFGLAPGSQIDSLSHRWLTDMFRSMRDSPRRIEPRGYESAVQMFDAGNERIYLPHMVPILGDRRTLLGVTVVLVDSTQLHRIDEAKSSLIATVSHELKTPLTSVQMCIHLALEDQSLTPRQRELIDTARQDALRLGEIIESLLDMGRLQAGRAELNLEPVPVPELIDEGLSPLLGAMSAGMLTFVRLIPPGLPPVLADRARMRHVFENLFSNAAKYTPAGGTVTVATETTLTHVQIKVIDSGPGIPAEYRAQIFEKFVRVPQDGSVPGAGLGLAIAREIIEAHGGKIIAETAPHQGAVFTLTLPRAHPANR